ncbi:hypothetical protein Ddye_025564 [Dipteronia dyeriana]|uniref:Uncharacterized protein n=1 Tax=Dipteronia dyeriana TaxID=168575 RepID=A0AAD9WNC7_9ROSI|nr:hypothetical protein Ddye_025564 [Dipteronia dyeriana]
MTEYLTKKKSSIDALQYTGNIITEDDKIMNILSGLGPEYDSFVIPVTSMPSCCSLPEITALLLAHEALINRYSQVDNLTVNMAENSQNFGHYRRGNSSGFPGNNRESFQGNNSGFNSGGRGNNFLNQGFQNQFNNGGRRGRGRGKNDSKFQCQIYHR